MESWTLLWCGLIQMMINAKQQESFKSFFNKKERPEAEVSLVSPTSGSTARTDLIKNKRSLCCVLFSAGGVAVRSLPAVPGQGRHASRATATCALRGVWRLRPTDDVTGAFIVVFPKSSPLIEMFLYIDAIMNIFCVNWMTPVHHVARVSKFNSHAG